MKSVSALLSGLLLFSVLAGAAEQKISESTCVETGRIHLLGDASSSFAPNKNRTKLIFKSYGQTSFRVFDMRTGESKEFERSPESILDLVSNSEVAITEYLPAIFDEANSAKKVIEATRKMRTTVVNIDTGQRRTVMGQWATDGELVSAVGVEDDNTLVLRSTSGREFRTPVPYSKSISGRIGIGGAPDVLYDRVTSQLTVYRDGAQKLVTQLKTKLDVDGTSLDARFSKDHRFLVISHQRNRSPVSRLTIVDTKSNSQQVLDIPSDYEFDSYTENLEHNALSPDGKSLVLASRRLPNEGLKIVDLQSGRIQTVKDVQGMRPGFDSSGRICVERENIRTCHESKTGKELSRVELPPGFSFAKVVSDQAVVGSIWDRSGGGSSFLFLPKLTCPKVIVPVECNCLIPKQPPIQKGLEAVRDLAVANACAKEFNSKDWANLPSASMDAVDEQSSVVLLKRFSKPGGFDPEKHTGVLLGMLKAGVHKGYPSQFRAAMMGVLYSSDRLYDSLVEKYPDLMAGSADKQCQTEKEREVLSKSVWNHVKSRIAMHSAPKFSEIQPLLTGVRDIITDAQKETLAEAAADQLVVSAGDSQELNQIFSSKVYKFAESKTRQALGLPFKDLTDITVVRDQNELRLIQLGTEAFAGSTSTLAGFHSKLVKNIAADSLPTGTTKERVTWQYGKDRATYSATIALNREQIDRPLVSTAKAPDYQEMWKGKVFRGVIIAGSNLGLGLTDKVTKSYIEYYTKQGFIFGDAKDENNIVGYLERKVSGAEPMHYFVKEAHSDGDEKNLFRMTSSGKVLTGVKMVNGRKEVVDIVFPSADTSSTLISNQDFGRWIKAREKAKQPELVYLNSSCWSKTKAVYEISAAASPKLINIPTTTSMVVFANNEKNVMRAVVDGIRNGRTYEEIRSSMQSDPGYQSGQKNVFIFPDEEKYKTNITDVLRVPVDVETKISKSKPGGKAVPYSIDESH